MSVRFDDIDLNSDVVPVERNDEGHGFNIAESTVIDGVSAAETLTDCPLVVDRVDEGLGCVDRGDSAESEMEYVDRDNDAEVADISAGGEIAANNGTVVLGLEGNVSNTDAFNGDSTCFGKNEGVDKSFGTFSEEAVVSRCREGISTGDEVEGAVPAVALTDCGEELGYHSADLQPVEEKLSMGPGGAVDLDLVSGDTIPMPTAFASGSLHGGVKPDSSRGLEWADERLNESSQLLTVNGDWKSGSGIDNEGTEVKGDMGLFVHLAGNTAPRVNGFGSNGNQGVVIEAQTKDIHQPQDIEKKNVKQAALKTKSQVKGCRTEKEGKFCVSDLVWGKVKSHPWWPGQIFDHSDSSEKARRYCKKGSFLIAYFGDQTFAWNEASRIKPFRMHFSRMEKQSYLEAFCHAVDCALEEVSRRVEFGLACSCLSKEAYDRIKTQIIVNAGISEESSRRDGGDEYSSVASFMPVNLVQFLKALAQSSYGGTDRLEFVIARAQLLAFNRWKGFCQLPEFKMQGGLLEDGADIPVTGKRKYSEGVTEDEIHDPTGNELVPLRKGKLVIQGSSSRKRKEIAGHAVSPSKKERRLSDLMSGSHSNLSNGESEPEGKAGRKLTTSSSVKKRKGGDSVPDDSRVKNKKTSLSPVTMKQFSRVGESILRVASQLAVSTPILKDGSKQTIGENGNNKRTYRTSSEKSKRRKVIPAEYPPPDEMLSQLCVAARDPMKGYNFLISSVSFFSNFRDSFCLENSNSQGHRKSTENVSGNQTGKKLSNSRTTETSELEGMEDSYWTDRIVQSNIEEHVLFEPETPIEKHTSTVEPEAALESEPKLYSKQETADVNCELEGKPGGHMDEKCEEEYTPTALILNFMDLESVPSESNLNKIFSRYGPLNELDTEVLKKSKRAKVVFKKRSDAESAFSSTGKFSVFGPSLVSYRLHYSPSTPRKTSTSAIKQSRQDATSVEGNDA